MTKKDSENILNLIQIAESLKELKIIVLGVNGQHGIYQKQEEMYKELQITNRRLDTLNTVLESKNEKMDDFISSQRKFVRGFTVVVIGGLVLQGLLIYIKFSFNI